MKTDASDMKVFARDYWSLMRPYRGPFLASLVWILLMQITALAEPYAVKYVIDNVLSHKVKDLVDLTKIVAALLAVLALGGALQIAKNWRFHKLIFLIDRDIPKLCIRKLTALPLSFHERENAGLLISKITKGINRTVDMTAVLLYEILAIAIQTVVTAAAISFVSPGSLGVFLVSVIAFGWVTIHVKQKLAPMRKRRHDDDDSSYEKISETTINVATVQAFAQEDSERKKIEDLRDGIYERAMPEYRTHFNYDYVRNGIVSLGRAIVIGLCAWSAVGGGMSMGTFVFVVALTDKVFISCYRIGSIFDRIQESSESIHRMVGVLNAEETIKDPPNPVDAPVFAGRVAFEGVTHQYPAKLPAQASRKKTKPALSDINLDIRAGETIGIVGPSGGGKSTLVKLLLRFDDPTNGRVTIDGIDLRLMRRADFRRQIGNVSQEVEIFDGTIARNIAYGRSDATPEQIIEAAKAANLHGFIESLPYGYDERVGNRGMRLSGGQRQRVGIARAVLMDPRVLVFDEATSQVDSISDAKIHRAIQALRRNRTTIIIAHRLATVQDADRIVVIDEGRVIEIGTHEELKAKQGLYAELMRAQQHAEDLS